MVMGNNPFGGFMPAVRNNSDALLQAGIGLLSGRTANEQAAMGLQGFSQGRQDNKTKQWIAQNAPPEIAQAVQAGVITPADGFKMLTEAKTKRAPLEVNGRLVDPETYQVLADFSNKPDGPKPTSLMIELQSAGIEPGSPQWNEAILNANKPKGMMLESDGQGGFRMVQGVGADGFKFTEAQSKDNVFSTRAKGALQVLDPIADNLSSLQDKVLDRDPTGLARGQLQSADYQVARTAGDEFLQAILRKDTGAAITPQEQEAYGKTYLPQPGDGPEVKEYKKQARARAVAAIEAGMSPSQILAQERALQQTAAPVAPPAADQQPTARRRYNPNTGMLE